MIDTQAYLAEFQAKHTDAERPENKPPNHLTPRLPATAERIATMVGERTNLKSFLNSPEANIPPIYFCADTQFGGLDDFLKAQVPHVLDDLPLTTTAFAKEMMGGGSTAVRIFTTAAVRSYIKINQQLPTPQEVDGWAASLAEMVSPMSAFPGRSALRIREVIFAHPTPFSFTADGQPFLDDDVKPEFDAQFELIAVGDADEIAMKQMLVGRCPAHGALEAFVQTTQQLVNGVYRNGYEDSRADHPNQTQATLEFIRHKEEIFEARKKVMKEQADKIKTLAGHPEGPSKAKAHIQKEVVELLDRDFIMIKIEDNTYLDAHLAL